MYFSLSLDALDPSLFRSHHRPGAHFLSFHARIAKTHTPKMAADPPATAPPPDGALAGDADAPPADADALFATAAAAYDVRKERERVLSRRPCHTHVLY